MVREKNNRRQQSTKRSETFERPLNVLSVIKKSLVVHILVGQRFTGSLLYTRNSFAAAHGLDHEQWRPRPCRNYSRSERRDEKNSLCPWSLSVLFTVCFQFLTAGEREKKTWKSFWRERTLLVGDKRVEIESSSACVWPVPVGTIYVLRDRSANYIMRFLYQFSSILTWNRTLLFQRVKHVGFSKYLKILRPRCNAPHALPVITALRVTTMVSYSEWCHGICMYPGKENPSFKGRKVSHSVSSRLMFSTYIIG